MRRCKGSSRYYFLLIIVSLQFFDDIYIPPAYLMANTIFNREEGVWVWNYDGQGTTY